MRMNNRLKILIACALLALVIVPMSLLAQTAPATSAFNYAGAGVIQAGDIWDSFLPQGMGITGPTVSGVNYEEAATAAALGVRRFLQMGNFDRAWSTPASNWPSAFYMTPYWGRSGWVTVYDPDTTWNRGPATTNPNFFALAAPIANANYNIHGQLTYKSTLAGATDPTRRYSIEPYFALAYYQNVLGGMRIKNINTRLERMLKEAGVQIDNLFERIFEDHGSIARITEIPAAIRKLFPTAHEIAWKDHLSMQAAWQKNIDNAITKTINLSSDETVDTVEKVYMQAWEMGCKGITIYRDNSKSSQVFEFGENTDKKTEPALKSMRQLHGGDKCPECSTPLIESEGCVKCVSCSFSLCQL